MSHQAFGLRIASELTLRGVGRAEGNADVVVRRASLGAAPIPLKDGEGWYRIEPGVHSHGWPDVGTFRVTASEVLYDPVPNAAEGITEHVLLGPVLASVLMLRGMLPLHASSNRIGDGVIALVGPSGRGKSSLAAALSLRGCPIHGDDLMGIPFEAPPSAAAARTSPPRVPFGVGCLKLNLDAARSLGIDAEALPPIYAGVEKRAWARLEAGAPPPEPLPLRAIYRLVDADAFDVVRVDPRKAAFEIMLNCFRPEVQQAGAGTRLIEMATAIAEHVPLYQFRRPRDLARLGEAAQELERHARAA